MSTWPPAGRPRETEERFRKLESACFHLRSELSSLRMELFKLTERTAELNVVELRMLQDKLRRSPEATTLAERVEDLDRLFRGVMAYAGEVADLRGHVEGAVSVAQIRLEGLDKSRDVNERRLEKLEEDVRGLRDWRIASNFDAMDRLDKKMKAQEEECPPLMEKRS